jgi:hypothetical protein
MKELKDCRNGSMQLALIFLNEGQEKITCLDLMKQKIDSQNADD